LKCFISSLKRKAFAKKTVANKQQVQTRWKLKGFGTVMPHNTQHITTSIIIRIRDIDFKENCFKILPVCIF